MNYPVCPTFAASMMVCGYWWPLPVCAKRDVTPHKGVGEDEAGKKPERSRKKRAFRSNCSWRNTACRGNNGYLEICSSDWTWELKTDQI